MDMTLNFSFSSIAKYAFVLTLGYLAGNNYQCYSVSLDRYRAIFVAPLLARIAFAGPWRVPKFSLDVISIPACHAMFRLNSAEFSGVFLTTGKSTFPIYLMNTAFIGLSKGVMLRFEPWDLANFFWFAPILLLVGVVGPILVKRWIIARRSVLNTIVA
ncbi:hypothetical protein N9D23_05985 [Rubripirellula sp.]|jgi:hypothetical protein|nr:hypothetical protein [Rubripirellula sp.]